MSVKTEGMAEPRAKRGRSQVPRTPTRGRGIRRYGELLDAADRLLHKENPDLIGLRQIAQEAGAPPASVYHFFPTKEAAFVALAKRYLEGLLAMHRSPIEAHLIGTWRDLMLIDFRRAKDYYNAHPPMNKILYGGYGGVEARKIDNINVSLMAKAHFGRLDRLFHMPHLSDPQRLFEVRMGILDAIWTLSVRQYGFITDESLEEAHAACAAYARLYLPEKMEPRPYLLDAVEQGGVVTLPFDDGDAPE